MKKTLIPLLLVVLCIQACKNKQERKVSPIDRTITAANAYNPFFLDSAAIENFLATEQLQEAVANKLRNFYYTRNFQFAWLTETGLTEQARGFWNLHGYYTNYNRADSSLNDKELNKVMSKLNETAEASLLPKDKKTIETELKLTEHFILYLQKNFEAGVLKYKSLENFVPKKKLGTMEWAKNILDTKEDDFEKENQPYKLLKVKLKQYYELAQKGGWQPIAYIGKPISKGMTAPQISSIKQRLHFTGQVQPSSNDSLFDDALERGIKNFQNSYGYTADGKLTDSLIKLMNLSLVQTIQQLVVNLNRMRWMPTQTDDRLIVANIPEYKLHVYENDKEAFNMNVVVGKEGHNTVVFFGKLSEIVFSPYWNIPSSIVSKEILPAIEKNPNYLEKHNMEKVGESYRQKPGGSNSLGKVKFLFPNAFNIYFHDTPAKDLFKKDTRAYSHGCIRIAEPQKMAEYLLAGQSEWNSQRIAEAMNASKEKSVAVKKPVPVIITYYTAWVDASNLLQFRADIYGHDAAQAKKLFTDAAL